MSDLDLMDTVLDQDEAELAKSAQRCLITALDHSKAVSISIEANGEQLDDVPPLNLPPKVLRLFADMLGAMAQGKAVTLVPKSLEVTTQDAAMVLNVSRPYLIKLLDDGKIPFHKLGTHRRILLEDVMKYKKERRQASLDALQELANQANELNLDD